MLPEGLSSSYKRYKDDTNIFSTWLGQTAVKCGYKPNPSARRVFSNASATSESSSYSTSSSSSIFSATSATSTTFISTSISNTSNISKSANLSKTSNRLKGKARKNAKKAKVSTSTQVLEKTVVIMSTRDLVEQAKVIAEHKKTAVVFPSVIHRVAERAIHARRRFLKWFQNAQSEDEEVNASHEHFIGVLETILDILTPCYESGKKENGKFGGEFKVKENLDFATNIFEMLDVEDIADEDLNAPELIPRRAKVIPKSTPLETYELDTDLEIDVPFISFCFFEDLHRIQEFVKETWKSHATGDLDICTAYLLTDYAVSIVEQEENRILKSLPAHHVHADSTMLGIVDNIYFPTMKHFQAPKEANDAADLENFLYYPVYQIINKTMHALQDCEPIDFPPIVPPLSLSLFSKVIEGQSNTDCIQEDDVKLTQFLLELAIHEKFQSYGGFKTPPNEFEDTITHSLRLFINNKVPGKSMSTAMVFGAALLLDIWRILGDKVGDSYEKLLLKSSMIKGKTRYTSPGTMEYDCTRQDFIEIWQEVHNFIQHNPIPCMKQTWLSTICDKETDDTAEALAWNIYCMQHNAVKNDFSRLDEHLEASPKLPKGYQLCAAEVEIMEVIKSKNLSTKWIRHSTDPTFFLRQNPLCTGLRTLELNLSSERAGLEFVLSNGTSFSIAHIYNAGKQMKYIKKEWVSLDKFIDANLHDIFTGGRPKTAHEFYTRALLGMGYSSTNLVQHRRRQGQIEWRDVNEKWKQPDVSKLLEQAISPEGDMNCGGDTIARSMFRLREFALASQKLSESQAKKLSVHHRTAIQILGELRDFLPGLMENMNIDYIGVTRKCDILMAQLHLTLSKHGLFVPVMPHLGSENFQLMINIMGHNVQNLRPDILKIASNEIARYIDDGDADWVEKFKSFAVPSSLAKISAMSLSQASDEFNYCQIPYAVIRGAGKCTSSTQKEKKPPRTRLPKSLDSDMSTGADTGSVSGSLGRVSIVFAREQKAEQRLEPGMSAGGLVLGGNSVMLKQGTQTCLRQATVSEDVDED
ncbi:hypothetical protein EYC80_009693 [Monilinia laxa]|uniref:DUF6604 domain-containing protein n=1 Tax=Monilinia laxa TaxID=61186 RepID=A0A5N6JYP2_MONLA|nr:hypothetical protein EYC80_009693 [Monilinia laxa]